MKKSEVKYVKELIISEHEIKIPDGWKMIKEPTKITNGNGECFKIVIARN